MARYRSLAAASTRGSLFILPGFVACMAAILPNVEVVWPAAIGVLATGTVIAVILGFRTQLVLDEQGLTICNGVARHRILWADVIEITSAPSHITGGAVGSAKAIRFSFRTGTETRGITSLATAMLPARTKARLRRELDAQGRKLGLEVA